MKSTISFFDSEFGGKSFDVPEELNIEDRLGSLLWLYAELSKYHYLTTYIGADPFGWFNDAVSDSQHSVMTHIKSEYMKNKENI